MNKYILMAGVATITLGIASDSQACNGDDLECGENCCIEITDGTDTRHARFYAAGSDDVKVEHIPFIPHITSLTLPEELKYINNFIFCDELFSNWPDLSTINCVDKGKGGCDRIREGLREYGYEGEFKVDFIEPEWNQKHYTPAEAAKWLKDDNNTITITFKK